MANFKLTYLILIEFPHILFQKGSDDRKNGCNCFCLSLLIIITMNNFTRASGASCFPPYWAGSWFHRGISEPVRITSDTISNKGVCVSHFKQHKYLIRERGNSCIRCMRIFENHHNVLSYKESNCKNDVSNWESICNDMGTDDTLFLMFRLETPPVLCPFNGTFIFNYSRGGGRCDEPISHVESCIEYTHLVFSFQACVDVPTSESRVEVLECFADIKFGSSHFFIGKWHHSSAKTNEDKFRCFIYEKLNDGTFQMAESGDASCDGLYSLNDGPRTMRLTRVNTAEARCEFPEWITDLRYWENLNRSVVYDFKQKGSYEVFFKTEAKKISTVTCYSEQQIASDYSEYVVHSTHGCNTGYICMRIYRRGKHIIQMQTDPLVRVPSEACDFRRNTIDYLTLITMDPETSECPLEGIYGINIHDDILSLPDKKINLCSKQSLLAAKCDKTNALYLETDCNSFDKTSRYNFECLGSWQEDDINFFIIHSKESQVQYCLSYRNLKKSDDGSLNVILSNNDCSKNNNRKKSLSGAILNGGVYDVNPLNILISFDLLAKGACHSTGKAHSNFHINQHILVLNYPLTMRLLLLFYCFFILKNFFNEI